jgi:hypothetical protein
MSKLETNTIDNVSGSSTLTIGDSNASTISIPKNITLGASGTTITVPAGATMVNNGTQTGFGGTNTPAFQAYLSSTQTISGSIWTKVQFNTDNSTNYRFTPTTAGKYFCYFMVNSSWSGGSGGYDLRSKFQKNGGNITGYTDAELIDFGDGANINLIGTSASGYAVINFNGSTDYLEVYHRSTAPTPFISGASYFGAYKIIE